MKILPARLLALSAVMLVVSCSASLRPTMPVPSIPVSADKQPATGAGHYIAIEAFNDARPSKVMAVKGIEQSVSTNDVGMAVQKALEQSFRNAGFAIDGSAPIMIRGEVRKWSANVTGSMSAESSAEAELYLEVLDPANKRIYYGTYQGFSGLTKSSMSLEDISQSLGVAMAQALAQVVNDKPLMTLLASF